MTPVAKFSTTTSAWSTSSSAIANPSAEGVLTQTQSVGDQREADEADEHHIRFSKREKMRR
jgi:hypothetical protein